MYIKISKGILLNNKREKSKQMKLISNSFYVFNQLTFEIMHSQL